MSCISCIFGTAALIYAGAAVILAHKGHFQDAKGSAALALLCCAVAGVTI